MLRGAGAEERLLAPLLLLVGASFALLRFGTENEVYLAPLLVSLLGSAAWVQWVQSRRVGWLLLAGTLTAGACLLHQIHFWWWLALGLVTWWGKPLRWREAVAYALPALLVPAAYLVAAAHEGYPLTPTGLVEFILHDYVVNGATPTTGPKNVLLTAINLVRSFVQVHGSGLALVKRHPALALVPLAGLGLLWRARGAWAGRRAGSERERLVARGHAWALGLHVLFAAINEGNAEFMVMVPPLVAVLAAARGRWRAGALWPAGAALLLWNVAFGIGPGHWLDFGTAPGPLVARVRDEPAAEF
ncbi:MAG TPA: hypothetical protein VD963_04690, partial [Phycisphaerales bacterium]|nr:hypothetical protein [Phycisphaerales bacterium]